MAVARRFVEAIEWTLAHDIVQLAKPRPVYVVLYQFYHMDPWYEGPYACTPFAVVSMNEERMGDGQIRVRLVSPFLDYHFTSYVAPIFLDCSQAARYIQGAEIDWDCDHTFAIGLKVFYGDVPDILDTVNRSDLTDEQTFMEYVDRRMANLYAMHLQDFDIGAEEYTVEDYIRDYFGDIVYEVLPLIVDVASDLMK